MSLITCPECGKRISESANVCPNCGYPISASLTNLKEDTILITKCPDCDTIISDKSVQCPNCACPPEYFIEFEQVQKTERLEQNENKPKKKRKGLVIIGGIIILLAVIFGGYRVYQNKLAREQYMEYLRQKEEEQIQQEKEREEERARQEAEDRRIRSLVSGKQFSYQRQDYNAEAIRHSIYFDTDGSGIEALFSITPFGSSELRRDRITWRVSNGKLVMRDNFGDDSWFSVKDGLFGASLENGGNTYSLDRY